MFEGLADYVLIWIKNPNKQDHPSIHHSPASLTVLVRLAVDGGGADALAARGEGEHLGNGASANQKKKVKR